MKPVQYKTIGGTVYVGFPGPLKSDGMITLYGACSISFLASKNYYDVRGVMTSTYPLELNLSSVQIYQELVDDTDSALAYCNYLGTLVATLKDPLQEYPLQIPSQFEQYIDLMNPLYIEQSQGVDIYLSGKYEYAAYCGDEDKVKEYRQQMTRIQREFKDKTLTEEEKTCSAKVVHLQFGSKGNASEKSED